MSSLRSTPTVVVPFVLALAACGGDSAGLAAAADPPPVARLTCPEQELSAGQQADIRGEAFDVGGGAVTAQLRSGAGELRDALTASFQYDAAGSYLVVLDVADETGQRARASCRVLVGGDDPAAPVEAPPAEDDAQEDAQEDVQEDDAEEDLVDDSEEPGRPGERMFAEVYALDFAFDELPRDWDHGGHEAEDVVDQIEDETAPLYAAPVRGGFRGSDGALSVNQLTDLGGADALSSMWAVRYRGVLDAPAEASSLVVDIPFADDVAVVIIDGVVVASADSEHCFDFLRDDCAPATSAPIAVTAPLEVEIIIANESGAAGWQVGFTFNAGGAGFLHPPEPASTTTP